MTVVDVLAAVAARLATLDAPLPTLWPGPPNVAGQLPAVWPSAIDGDTTSTRDRPITVAVTWVPAPRNNDVQWPDMWAAVDRLAAVFAAPLPGGCQTTRQAWRADQVTVGDVDRDAVVYELSITYPAC